jgi:predicted phage terminase large subunit-like protein
MARSSRRRAPKLDPRLQAARLLAGAVAQARRCPSAFAELCFTDPTGHRLRQGRVHRELQEFLTQHRRALLELPRDHGKSMQVCMRLLWELGHEPCLRIKIVSASEALATERGRFLRDAIAGNERLHLVFPCLLPHRPWEAACFSVERPVQVLGPSVAALGIDAASTGTRADLLVCDDIVDVRSLRSRAERERVKLHFRENLLNLLEPDGRFWGLFTPWHIDDLNSELKRQASFAHFRRAVGDDLEPVWPEKWSRELLRQRREEIGAVSFARAYRLVCVPSEETLIRPEWIGFWTDTTPFEWLVLSVDPALSKKSTADFSALVTLGRTAEDRVHCLEALARRVSAPELVELIDDADRRHRPDVILFESNAAFDGIRELLVRHAVFGAKIKGVVQTRDKMSRVHAFSVAVENKRFLLQGTPGGGVSAAQQGLFDEMTLFPFAEHDDLLDAAASGTAYLLDRPEPRVWGI